VGRNSKKEQNNTGMAPFVICNVLFHVLHNLVKVVKGGHVNVEKYQVSFVTMLDRSCR
jgi:hypothetical protein